MFSWISVNLYADLSTLFFPNCCLFSNRMFVRYNFVLYAYKNSYHKGLPPLTHRLGLETAYKNVILSGVRLHKSLLFFYKYCPCLHDNRVYSSESFQQRVDDTCEGFAWGGRKNWAASVDLSCPMKMYLDKHQGCSDPLLEKQQWTESSCLGRAHITKDFLLG